MIRYDVERFRREINRIGHDTIRQYVVDYIKDVSLNVTTTHEESHNQVARAYEGYLYCKRLGLRYCAAYLLNFTRHKET